jgi:hypothetical protein
LFSVVPSQLEDGAPYHIPHSLTVWCISVHRFSSVEDGVANAVHSKNDFGKKVPAQVPMI